MGTVERLTLAVLAAALVTSIAAGEDFACSVTTVSSGHIFQINNSGMVELAVLDGIKCPRSNSQDGMKAKAFTSERVRDKQVRVTVIERRDKMAYVELYLTDGTSLAELLLQVGLAIWNGKLGPRAERYRQLERDARKREVGLWAAPGVKAEPETKPAQPPQQPAVPMLEVDSKKTTSVLGDEPSPLSTGTSTIVLRGQQQKDDTVRVNESAVTAERQSRRKKQESALTGRGAVPSQQGGKGGFGFRGGR